MQTEITKTLKQAAVSVLVFGAVLFAFSRVDWLNTFGLKETVVEDKLGELWWDVYSSDAAFVDDSLRVLPVDSLLDALCRANDIDRSAIFLHLVEDEEVNAFACPGNHLVVNTALLDSCHNADELSGVMAHELAHLTQGHVMQKLVKEIGLSALVVMTSGSGGTETLGEVARVLTSTAYDRTLESEADALAVHYLLAAGIDPNALADFLLRLSAEEELPALAEWISTHPSSAERARRIRQLAAEGKQAEVPGKFESDRRLSLSLCPSAYCPSVFSFPRIFGNCQANNSVQQMAAVASEMPSAANTPMTPSPCGSTNASGMSRKTLRNSAMNTEILA